MEPKETLAGITGGLTAVGEAAQTGLAVCRIIAETKDAPEAVALRARLKEKLREKGAMRFYGLVDEVPALCEAIVEIAAETAAAPEEGQ